MLILFNIDCQMWNPLWIFVMPSNSIITPPSNRLLPYICRFVESFWFTFVTQSNHLPNSVDDYKDCRGWCQQQCRSTCNIDPGWFNNWFTGHLNYQIEHQLVVPARACVRLSVSSLCMHVFMYL